MFKIKMFFIVKNYTNVEEMLVTTKDVERLLGELGETPFEPFKKEHEKGMHSDSALDKHVIVLNESFINFFKGFSFGVGVNPHIIKGFIVCELQIQ
jgi:hypothetical protein